MIKLTKEELSRFKPVSNMILVKPNRGNDEILLGDLKLYLDISYHKEVHSPVMGTIVAVPDSLNPKAMQWDVDMEVRPGDVAWYSYLSAQNAIDPVMGRTILCEGEAYFMIPYEEVFVVKGERMQYESTPIEKRTRVGDREFGAMWPVGMKEQILPVNGYCLVEPVEEIEEWKIGNLVLERPGMSEKMPSSRYGRVAYVSKGLVRKYNDGDGVPDEDQVSVGDYICFDVACDLIVEYDLHAKLDGKKMFYRMQRRYIHAIIPENLVKELQ